MTKSNDELERVLFRDYCHKIMELKRKSDISDNGFYTHWSWSLTTHIIPYFYDFYIDEIKYTDIESFFLSKKTLSHDSLKIFFSALRTVFDYACYDDIITKNPCKFYKLKVGTPHKEKPCYTSEQADLIIRYCHIHRFGLDVFMMLKTGISRAELLGIKWCDIDLKQKIIHINKDVIDNYEGKGCVHKMIVPTKNKYRTRYIAIDDETVAFLKTQNRKVSVTTEECSRVIESDFLIHNKFGDMCSPRTWRRRHYDVFMRDMQEFYSKYGIEIPIYTPHCLRHTKASIFLNNGCAPAAIIAQMGWADYTMLNKIYGHRDIQQLRKYLDM